MNDVMKLCCTAYKVYVETQFITNPKLVYWVRTLKVQTKNF